MLLFAQEVTTSVAVIAGIFTPWIGYLTKQIVDLKTEVKECHKQREAAKVQLAVYGERLKALEKKNGIKRDSEIDIPTIPEQEKADE